MQGLCRDKQADVQEGLVHFFPALLRQLPCASRSSFFQTLTQSLSLDCATWRCRIGLAEQLGSLASLEVCCIHKHAASCILQLSWFGTLHQRTWDWDHGPSCILQGLQPDILPIAMMLCQDPTAAVRSAVAKQMGRVVCELWSKPGSSKQSREDADLHVSPDQLANHISDMSVEQTEDPSQRNEDSDMQTEIVHLIQSLASQDAYQLRQQFVEVCYHIAEVCCEVHMNTSTFQSHFMPTMLKMAQDQVANVRLTLARALNQLSTGVLTGLPEVLGTLDSLARDADPDVANCVTQQHSHKIVPT